MYKKFYAFLLKLNAIMTLISDAHSISDGFLSQETL